MTPNPFGGSVNRELSSVSLFEIRLHENPVILRGCENAAPATVLRGTVVLLLNEPLSLRSLRMSFKGDLQIGDDDFGAHSKERIAVLRRTWTFIPRERSGVTLDKGNHVWDFDHEIPGNTLESLEGLSHTFITYRLKATIDRGLLQWNSAVRKHVRIIRTLDPTSYELCQSVSVAGRLTDKLMYSINIPTKAVAFGSAIRVEFKLTPLMKGVTIKTILSQLLERRNQFLIRTLMPIREVRVVVRDDWVVPENIEMVEIDGLHGYKLHRLIQIPRSLTHCLQSTNTAGIEVNHLIKFTIGLQAPDGQQFAIPAVLPIFIFISPHLPPNDDNTIIGDPVAISSISDMLHTAPPQYSLHHLDRLYSDIDLSPYLTPARGTSGATTPFLSSRSASNDNIPSMSGEGSSGVAAGMLQLRLHNLGTLLAQRERAHLSSIPDDEVLEAISAPSAQVGEPAQSPANVSSSRPVSTLSHSRETSGHGSPISPVVWRASAEDPAMVSPNIPQPMEFSTEALCKVPSYRTARNARPPPLVYDGLPNYQTAIRTPIVPATASPTAAVPTAANPAAEVEAAAVPNTPNEGNSTRRDDHPG